MKYLTGVLLLSACATLLSAQTHAALQIQQLTGDYYIFTTWNKYQNEEVPANGLYLVTNAGVLLVDTPWDTTQFQPLLDSIHARHHQPVVMCIATHFHEDRTGGLAYYRRKGIRTYTTRLTDEWCIKNHEKRAEFLLEKDTVFQLGQYSCQTFYPGPGHTPDNIVLWFQQGKVLYGGCFIKSMEASTLGNLSDANPKAWPESLRKVMKKFKKQRFVIPGHQSWNDVHALQHTLKLAKNYNQNNSKK